MVNMAFKCCLNIRFKKAFFKFIKKSYFRKTKFLQLKPKKTHSPEKNFQDFGGVVFAKKQ